eukprot:CAMPEP_0182542846 /NCGR_PEP_ID=MMETSP1323-20130603/30752_1 /TAXON_ID=236787 /ORGANISM="Florenciella parvula, Strain RCC1693" /LENGTH=125 /DNA_ID=CAMNT_0024753731 /DNA_START=28 /DNA_END=404 /DNA_ORIENTATION=+
MNSARRAQLGDALTANHAIGPVGSAGYQWLVLPRERRRVTSTSFALGTEATTQAPLTTRREAGSAGKVAPLETRGEHIALGTWAFDQCPELLLVGRESESGPLEPRSDDAVRLRPPGPRGESPVP